MLYRPRRHDDAVTGFTLLPEDASASFKDPRVLWYAIERRGRSMGTTRVVGLSFVLGLPREAELSLPECAALVRCFAELLHDRRLPVRADIHRVLDDDGHVAHRHAHLTVGLYPVMGSEIGRTLERRWLPVVRGRLVHALDWSAIWTRVQAEFFRERCIDLAVPPPSGLAEPQVTGRPKRGSKAVLAGRSREQARDDVRTGRRLLSTDPAEVLRILTQARSIVSRTELQAFLAGAGHEPDAVADQVAAVLGHEDVIRFRAAASAVADEPLFTSRLACERAATILADVAGMRHVSVSLAPIAAGLLPELRVILDGIGAALDPDRHLVVVWSDAWLRRELADQMPWPRGCRQIAARHLAELDRRDAAVLRWSPGTTVVVLSADRLDDVELEILVARASRAGAALRLGVVLEGPVTRAERGIAPLLVEQLLGTALPLPRRDAISLQILQQRLGRRGDAGPAQASYDDIAAVTIGSNRPDVGAADAEDDARAGGIRAADLPAMRLTPRQAWADPPKNAEILVRDPSDWLWAGSLLRHSPHLDVSFAIAGSDRAFIAGVIEHIRWGRDALGAVIGVTTSGGGSGAGAASNPMAPSLTADDPADRDLPLMDSDEPDGLDRDTEFDAEMAADPDPKEELDYGDWDADHDESDEHRETGDADAYDEDDDPEDPTPEF
ncbi:MobA/MobL family protein [Methylobacterium sp. J-001]|nr:MobA/MobL family protein [Methylobacterium sp. J-001]